MGNKMVTLVPTDWVLVPIHYGNCLKPQGGLMQRLILLASFFRNVSAMATSWYGDTKCGTRNLVNHTSELRNGRSAADCRGTAANRNCAFGTNEASISGGDGTSPVVAHVEMSGGRVCHSR